MNILTPTIKQILDRGMMWRLHMRPLNERKVSVSMWFRSMDDAMTALRQCKENPAITFAAVYQHQPWIPNKPTIVWAFVSNTYSRGGATA